MSAPGSGPGESLGRQEGENADARTDGGRRRGGGGGGLRFSSRELLDFAVAWLALGLAFAIFFGGGGTGFLRAVLSGEALRALAISLLAAGVAFLLHELAHKVVAIRFGQAAEFRADYGMLALAVMSATVGFLFAAPGAVHHRGRITERQHGLVALAGPVTNLLLAVPFAAVLVAGSTAGSRFLFDIGVQGTAISLFLAAFNLIPFGSLDGRTVLSWSKLVWGASFLVSAGLAAAGLFVLLPAL